MAKWKSLMIFALEAFEQIKSEERRLREQWLTASDFESRAELQAHLIEIAAQAMEKNVQILALLRDCPSKALGLYPLKGQACH